MSILRAHRPPVKRARRTARPDAAFGAGLFRFTPFAVLAPGFTEPSDADRAAAALMFADDETPDYDTLAAEAAWYRQFEDTMAPPVGHCRSCGQPSELLPNGWCERRDSTAAEVTIASENGRAGLGYRVF